VVGAWLLDVGNDPGSPPTTAIFHADGTYIQTDGVGTGIGSWAATGPTTGDLTFTRGRRRRPRHDRAIHGTRLPMTNTPVFNVLTRIRSSPMTRDAGTYAQKAFGRPSGSASQVRPSAETHPRSPLRP